MLLLFNTYFQVNEWAPTMFSLIPFRIRNTTKNIRFYFVVWGFPLVKKKKMTAHNVYVRLHIDCQLGLSTECCIAMKTKDNINLATRNHKLTIKTTIHNIPQQNTAQENRLQWNSLWWKIKRLVTQNMLIKYDNPSSMEGEKAHYKTKPNSYYHARHLGINDDVQTNQGCFLLVDSYKFQTCKANIYKSCIWSINVTCP